MTLGQDEAIIAGILGLGYFVSAINGGLFDFVKKIRVEQIVYLITSKKRTAMHSAIDEQEVG